MTTVGQNVHELRMSKGITQAELAKMVGTYPSKISLLERNHDNPGPDLLARVYQTLAALPDAAAVTPSKKNLRHGPRPKPIDTTTRGGIIRKARIEKGLTQQELAHLAGVSMPTIVRLENNSDSQFHSQTLKRVSKALNIKLKDPRKNKKSEGKNLQQLRREKGITRNQLAEIVGKPVWAIFRIENGLFTRAVSPEEIRNVLESLPSKPKKRLKPRTTVFKRSLKPEPKEESRRPFLRLNLLPKIDKNIDFLLDHWLYVDEPTGASVFEHIHPVPGLEHLPEANRLRPRSHETPWWWHQMAAAKPPKESRDQMAARIEERRHYVAILHSWGCTYKEGLSRLQELGHFINPVTWFRDVKHVKDSEADTTTGSVDERDVDLLEVS